MVDSLNTHIYRGQKPMQASDRTQGTISTNPLTTPTSRIDSPTGQDTLIFIPREVKERIEQLTDNPNNRVSFYDKQGNTVEIRKVGIDSQGKDIYEYTKTHTGSADDVVKIQFSFNPDTQRAQDETESVYQGLIDNGADAAANRAAMQEVKQAYQEGYTLTIYQYEDSSQMSEGEDVVASATMLAGTQPLWGTKDGLGLLEEAVERADLGGEPDGYPGHEIEKTDSETILKGDRIQDINNAWQSLSTDEKILFLTELHEKGEINQDQLHLMLSRVDRRSSASFSDVTKDTDFDLEDRDLSGTNYLLEKIKEFYDNKDVQRAERREKARNILYGIYNFGNKILNGIGKFLKNIFGGNPVPEDVAAWIDNGRGK